MCESFSVVSFQRQWGAHGKGRESCDVIMEDGGKVKCCETARYDQ